MKAYSALNAAGEMGIVDGVRNHRREYIALDDNQNCFAMRLLWKCKGIYTDLLEMWKEKKWVF